MFYWFLQTSMFLTTRHLPSPSATPPSIPWHHRRTQFIDNQLQKYIFVEQLIIFWLKVLNFFFFSCRFFSKKKGGGGKKRNQKKKQNQWKKWESEGRLQKVKGEWIGGKERNGNTRERETKESYYPRDIIRNISFPSFLFFWSFLLFFFSSFLLLFLSFLISFSFFWLLLLFYF